MPDELELFIKLEADLKEFESKLNKLAENFGKKLNDGVRENTQLFSRSFENVVNNIGRRLSGNMQKSLSTFESGYRRVIDFLNKEVMIGKDEFDNVFTNFVEGLHGEIKLLDGVVDKLGENFEYDNVNFGKMNPKENEDEYVGVIGLFQFMFEYSFDKMKDILDFINNGFRNVFGDLSSGLQNILNELNSRVRNIFGKIEGKSIDNNLNNLFNSFSEGFSEDVIKSMNLFKIHSMQGYDELARYYSHVLSENLEKNYGKLGSFIGMVVGSTGGLFGRIKGPGVKEWGEAAGIASSAGGIAKIAVMFGGILNGVVQSVGLLGAILKQGQEYSGYARATLKVLNTTFKLALKPLADMVGMILLPIAVFILRYFVVPMVKLWSRFMNLIRKEGGKEGFNIGGAVGAIGGLVGGAALGSGLGGAALGSTIGEVLGAVVGGPIGILIGMALGAIIGAGLDILVSKIKEWGSQLANFLKENKTFQSFMGKIRAVFLIVEGYFMKSIGFLGNAVLEIAGWFLGLTSRIVGIIGKITGSEKLSGISENLKSVSETFRELDLTSVGEKIVEEGKVLWAIADAIGDMPDSVSSTTEALELLFSMMGADAAELVEEWRNGSIGLEDLARELVEMGYKKSDVDRAKSQAGEFLESVEKSFQGLNLSVEDKQAIVGIAIDSLYNNIVNSAVRLSNAIESAIDTAIEKLTDILGKYYSISGDFGYYARNPNMPGAGVSGNIYMRQTGGEIPETGLYLMHRGEVVIPAWKVPEVLSGGGVSVGSVNVTVNVDKIDNELDLEWLAEEIGVRVMRNISRYGGV